MLVSPTILNFLKINMCYNKTIQTHGSIMEDIIITNEIVKILSSKAKKDEKVKQFEDLIEQIKVAYYVKSANDINRYHTKIRKDREEAILEQDKNSKVISLRR